MATSILKAFFAVFVTGLNYGDGLKLGQARLKLGSALIWRNAAVLKTSRSILYALRLTLRAQPRPGNFKLRHYLLLRFAFTLPFGK